MFYWLIIFALGLVVGSFLNVCIYRLPREESVVFPASHCAQCQKKLSALDLIPVFSYLFLRGKCRYCQEAISWRYPVVELLTGALFVLVVSAFSSVLSFVDLVFYCGFCSILIVIFFTDLEGQVIPDLASFGGIAIGLGYKILQGFSSGQVLVSSVVGLILGLGLFYLIAKLGKLYFKKEAMGEGDIYLAGLLGVWLGWQGLLLAIFLAYLLAALVLVPFLLSGKLKMEAAVPFGPALVTAGLLTLFFGQQIISWYGSLLL